MSSDAERAERYRNRQRAGRVVLPVEVDLDRLADALRDAGRLPPFTEDRVLIADAVANLLDDLSNLVTRDRLRREARGIFKP